MDLTDSEQLRRLIDAARADDLGAGDLTTRLLPHPDEPARFRLVARQRGVFAGCQVAAAVLSAYDDALEITWSHGVEDGAALRDSPAELAAISGPLHHVLAAERVLLNFLQRLCGVATLTRSYVDAIAGTGAAIYDTRKTLPGWRLLDKYAVRCGGGRNHRRGLFDAILIKDNHLAGIPPDRLAGAVFDMLNRAAGHAVQPTFVEVEADTLDQVDALLKVVGINVILLDNFELDDLRRAVALRDGLGLRDKVELEASGGISLRSVRDVAESGVERISVGAITHSAPAVDLALERIEC